jgi:nitrogen fixation NifU-like protein
VLDDLYRESILRHYQSPSHRRVIVDPDAEGFSQNPLCGDELSVTLRLDERGRIADAAFQARGCSISQASADIMAEAVRGMSKEEAEALSARFHACLHSDDDAPDLGELGLLRGVRRFPSRIKCALLPWDTLGQALASGQVSDTVVEGSVRA